MVKLDSAKVVDTVDIEDMGDKVINCKLDLPSLYHASFYL